MESPGPGALALPRADGTSPAPRGAARQQVRGSSLLLLGRLLGVLFNLAGQVLMIRYLSKSDYGAFAYVTSLVMFGETLSNFGMARAAARFIPIYHEERQYARVFGVLALSASTMIAIGLALVLLLHGMSGVLGARWLSDRLVLDLLLIMMLLAPVQALDDLLNGMFAIFGSPRAIFFRKHLMHPLLKLAVVALLVWGGADVYFLAEGYVVIGVAGVLLYGAYLLTTLRRHGLLEGLDLRRLDFPARALFHFTLPLLTTDLVLVAMNTLDAVILEFYNGTLGVAAYRAVQPTAKFNHLVLHTFSLLFMPAAARLFARGDRKGLDELYWQTAIWTAILSFPIFALTFSLAHPLTLLLFGERYEESAILLAILSLGYYFNAALGQNGQTLQAYGKVRYVVAADLLAVGVSVLLNLLFIPRWGAIGAAAGTASTMIAYNLFKQIMLARGTAVSLFPRAYRSVYARIAAAALALLLVQAALSPPLLVGLPLAALLSLLVLWTNREALDVEHTFPEMARLPFVARLFRPSRRGG